MSPVEGSTTLVAKASARSSRGKYVHLRLPSAYPLTALFATLESEITEVTPGIFSKYQ